MVPQEQDAGWFLLIAEIVAAVMCVPLIRGRVRRNGLYGLRTKETLANDRVWFEANRLTSRAMLVTNLAAILVTGLWLLAWFAAPLWMLSVPWVVSLLGVAVYGMRVGRSLSNESPDSG